MMIKALTPEQYADRRAIYAPILKKAAIHGDISESTAFKRIKAGQYIAVVFETEVGRLCGVMVLELVKDALHVTLLAGRLERTWREQLWPVLCGVAKGQGRDYIQLGGRKGWRRYLQDWGFEPFTDDLIRARVT